MRSYWAKIVLGAVAIFMIGYGAVWVVRTQVVRVKHTFESSDPISIPLAFLPFVMDGAKLGTYRGVRIVRSAPKTVTEVHIRVRLADTVSPGQFEGCRLTTQNSSSFSPEQGLRCIAATAADSALIPFGDVTFELRGRAPMVLPLLLDSAVVSDLAGGRAESAVGDLGRQEAAAARARAGAAAAEAQGMGDSIRAAVEAKVRAGTRRP
jgi:hypothetical protein